MTATPDAAFCAICDRVPGTPVPKPLQLCRPCALKVGELLLDEAEKGADENGGAR